MHPQRIGHYLITSRIGCGGHGEVFKGIDERLNRQVAVKVLRKESIGRSDNIARLRREALVTAKLDHPYICKVYDIIDHDDQTMIIMEYCDGETLQDLLRSGPLNVSETLHIATELAEALVKAHEHGLVHRDIKPANIMITSNHHIKVMDFGIVKYEAHDDDSDITKITTEGIVLGTLKYMSPEQALGDSVNSKADIFSFGIVIHECLTGALPFNGPNYHSYVKNLLTESPKPLQSSLPSSLINLISRCLEKRPEDRFISAVALVDALKSITDEVTIAESVTSTQTMKPWQNFRSNAGLLLFTSIVICLLVIGYTGGIFRPSNSIQRGDLPRLDAAISWGTSERNGRISPDKHWLSFISNRSGSTQIWIQRLHEGVPTGEGNPLPLGSKPFCHLWNPTSTSIAYIETNKDRGIFLHYHDIDSQDDTAQHRIGSYTEGHSCSLIRWIGEHVYFTLNGVLWLHNIESGQIEQITTSNPEFGYYGIDINHTETAIVYATWAGGAEPEELWIADIDGENKEQLTDDLFRQQMPRWLDHTSDSIVYLSNAGEQMDIWQMDIRTGQTHQISSSWAVGLKQDGFYPADDGSLLVLDIVLEEMSTWYYPADGSSEYQITEENRDLWPSLSHEAEWIAFQRLLGTSGSGYFAFDGQIHFGPLSPDNEQSYQLIARAGFRPVLSPDGNWVTYYQYVQDWGYELWIFSHSDSTRMRISSDSRIPDFSTYPLDWNWTNLVWNRDSSRLYFIQYSENTSGDIYELDVTEAQQQPRLLRPASNNSDRIYSLSISPDNHFLCFLRQLPLRNTIEICVLDIQTRELNSIYDGDIDQDLFVKGWWYDAGPIVLLKEIASQPEEPNQYQLFLVELDGTEELIDEFTGIKGGNPVFHAESSSLYLTISDGVSSNLYRYSLTSQILSPISTTNQFTGTYSGIQVTSDGSVICTKHESKLDIGMIRLNH